jgi:hypothetical protein
MVGWLLAVLVFLAGVTGCTSPEATRTRGGGPGADVGNRSEHVEMHAGSQPYWKTPQLIPAKHPSLESAQHARRQGGHK